MLVSTGRCPLGNWGVARPATQAPAANGFTRAVRLLTKIGARTELVGPTRHRQHRRRDVKNLPVP